MDTPTQGKFSRPLDGVSAEHCSLLEVIHKSEFGVSEQSIFVGTILILVNGHPRGGVSAFFREISAFFLIGKIPRFSDLWITNNN